MSNCNILLGFLCITPLAFVMATFVPSNEWQFVPENVAIPGGLEVRLDLEKGGRWARILQDNIKESHSLDKNAADPTPQVYDPSSVTLDNAQLDAMEEKAHDYDHGVNIAHLYGPALFEILKDASNPNYDQAGRIVSICIRNNDDATRAWITVCPDLSQAFKFNRRSLLIVGSLVSNSEGRDYLRGHDTLKKVRGELVAAGNIESTTSKAISKLLQDLAIADGGSADLCNWVDALQQAHYTTKNPELKQLAIDIVEHKGEFESLKIECKPQPGLLSPHEERKRAAKSARRFGNRLASRNHFDEL